MTSLTAYSERLKALLSADERNVFARLSSPQKVQDYVDGVPVNLEETGETILSPRRVLRENRAHCIEGALFAAACFAYHGQPALILNFQAAAIDVDHVVTLFRRGRLWGAISKTNHAVLRWRDPVYRTVRELAMSYFHEYLAPNGKKSLRAISRPFDLGRYAPETWVTAEQDLEWLQDKLNDLSHAPLLPRGIIPRLRDISALEQEALKLVERKAIAPAAG
ncbi:MAG TPA: hypothetical protein VK456_04060 [Xanthobacteraceae bacterium]|nr:hypothetical protein [Xanthobacteraceae bacterium]